MNEFQDQFPQEMPRPNKRQSSDEVVLPPDESMLSADDLLLGIPEPVLQAASTEESHGGEDDQLFALPPDAMSDAELDVQVDLPVQQQAPSHGGHANDRDNAMELSIQFDSEGDAVEQATMDPLRVGVLDPHQLEASDGDVVDLQAQPSDGREKPLGFIEKHKPKLVIALVLSALMGVKFYQDGKKAEMAAASVPQIDPAATQVQSAAIADMQQGSQDVSPLQTGMAIPPADDASVEALFGEDVSGQSVNPLPPTAVQPVEPLQLPQAAPVASAPADPAPSIAPIAPVAPVAPAVGQAAPDVAPGLVQDPQQQAAQPLAEVQSGAASAEQPVDAATKLKDDLSRAEARLREAETEIARLRTEAGKPSAAEVKPVDKAPVVKSPVVKPRHESRAVSSARSQPSTTQPAVSGKRTDIEYIGSFLSGSQWGAHVVIAGNLYELSAGQRIANLKVDSVTGSGVTINGVNYH